MWSLQVLAANFLFAIEAALFCEGAAGSKTRDEKHTCSHTGTEKLFLISCTCTGKPRKTDLTISTLMYCTTIDVPEILNI